MPAGSWSLVGGLMVHLHARHAGLTPIRPTADVDALLHVETGRITFPTAISRLEQLGYRLHDPGFRDSPYHRLNRGTDIVDVLVADHVPPRRLPTFRRRSVMQAPGGTSALRRTVECRIRQSGDGEVVLSLPDTLGALTLKGGAYLSDTRDRERHLEDAAILFATITDPTGLRAALRGSDGKRIRALASRLTPDHPAWAAVPPKIKTTAQDAMHEIADPRPGPSKPRQITKPDFQPLTGQTPPEQGHVGQESPRTGARAICGARTATGGRCRNPAASCPHHR